MKWPFPSRQILQSAVLIVVALTFIFQVPAKAQQLPIMKKSPWFGFFSGYKQRNFEFGINNEGECELYLIGAKTKERVGLARIIKIYTEVLVENDQGKLSTKRIKDDDVFSTELKPGLDHEVVKFTATATGDAKVEVTVKYDRKRIILDGRILDRGTFKEGKLYLSFKVKVPAMYGPTYNSADKKKIKSVMRKDRIKFTRATDKERVSLKSYEVTDLGDEKLAKGGVTDIVVAMEAQEGNDFMFTTLDGAGVIDFENKNAPLWKGYYVKWKREYIEVVEGDKSKKTKGISPLVIEIK